MRLDIFPEHAMLNCLSHGRLIFSHRMCVLRSWRSDNIARIQQKHFGQVVVTVELDSRSDRGFFRVFSGFAISLLLIVPAPTAGSLSGAAAPLDLQHVRKPARRAIESHVHDSGAPDFFLLQEFLNEHLCR